MLRQRGRPLEKTDFRNPLVQKLIDDMIETMHEYNGVGLAAPQVHESLRLFVALLEDEPDGKSAATVVINPEIVPNAETREEGWEGCLSIPDIRGHGAPLHRHHRPGARPRRPRVSSCGSRIFPRAWRSTRPITSTASSSSIGWPSMQSLTYLEEFSRFHSKDDD